MKTVPTERGTPVEAARLTPCPVCHTPAGQPCHPRPAARPADHLARYTAARNDRRITACELGQVLDGLDVIINWALVPEVA